MTRQALAVLFAAAAAAVTAPALALAGPISMTTTAMRETTANTAAGATERKLAPLTRAVPGDVVVYVLTVRNSGAVPADKLILNDPIAKGAEYLAPREGPTPQVSVDGGKTFGSLPQLTVHGSDGSTRAALPSDVTNLRWTLPTPVPAGGEGRVAFATKLK